MRAAMPPNFFDKARRFAAAGIVLAGLSIVTGSFLEWAVITEREVAQDVDFGTATDDIEPGQAEPFTGVDDRDGKITVGAGVAVIVVAGVLLARKRTGWAWLAFWISVVVGGIAFGDYRSVANADETISGIAGRQEVGAEAMPGAGLTLVAAGAVLGVISSVGAVAATPRTD